MIVVTTTTRPHPGQVDRARSVSERTGAPFVARSGAMAPLLAAAGAKRAYVVGRDRDEIVGPDASVHVHAGLLGARLSDGPRHPLLRAVAPGGRGSIRRVFDGTLGLAQDALHLAAGLGVEVLGVEASPFVACLLEEGLGRLARGDDPVVAGAAAAIRPVAGRCGDVLATQADASWDVVFLEPMFDRPRAAAPGYAVFRGVALHATLDEATVAQALRVGRRLVVKVPSEAAAPDAVRPWSPSRIAGRAVDYWVVPSIVAGPRGRPVGG